MVDGRVKKECSKCGEDEVVGVDSFEYWHGGLVLDTVFFFFFNDTATTEIYTLSLHDALPICS